jgi:hypothetical protein
MEPRCPPTLYHESQERGNKPDPGVVRPPGPVPNSRIGKIKPLLQPDRITESSFKISTGLVVIEAIAGIVTTLGQIQVVSETMGAP